MTPGLTKFHPMSWRQAIVAVNGPKTAFQFDFLGIFSSSIMSSLVRALDAEASTVAMERLQRTDADVALVSLERGASTAAVTEPDCIVSSECWCNEIGRPVTRA